MPAWVGGGRKDQRGKLDWQWANLPSGRFDEGCAVGLYSNQQLEGKDAWQALRSVSLARYLRAEDRYLLIHEVKNDEAAWLSDPEPKQLRSCNRHEHKFWEAVGPLYRYIMEQVETSKAAKAFRGLPSDFFHQQHQQSLHGLDPISS